MNLPYIFVTILETLLRFFPIPCRTGLIKIGNPNRNSPVFLTCNYHLTVERVKRALSGIDAYLLVANSKGINVWCAATGGYLTNHDVVSVLRTSRINEIVDKKVVIAPQLGSTGIESKVIHEKTGWRIIWGPVYAKDIPYFIRNNFKKNLEMRIVKFPWTQRMEMAIAWAFPISLILALIMIPLWYEATWHLVFLVWGLSLLIFISFPLYSHWLDSGGKRIGLIFFDFGRGGVQLILWFIIIIGLAGYSILVGNYSSEFIFRWGLISFIIVLILSIDLMGSTPVYKSGLQEDRLMKVTLDEKKCKGAGFCEQVCPRNCFKVDKNHRIATIPKKDRCVQCGACIVQCPFDALYFENSRGGIITPETIRKFKLNLMGKRLIKARAS